MSRRDGAGEVLELIRKGRAEKIGDIATAMGMARSTVALRWTGSSARGWSYPPAESQPPAAEGGPSS